MSQNIKKQQETMQEQLKSLLPHLKSISEQRAEQQQRKEKK